MAETAHTVIARKAFRCEGYRCNYTIRAGEPYARHVAFPGSDVNGGTRPWVLRICIACQAPAAMPPRRARVAEPLPVIARPNGKPYQPRKIVAHSWEDEYRGERGVVVFGTHNVERALPFAEEACRYFHGIQHAIDPRQQWLRDGFSWGERCWIRDEDHGRAAVMFTASDDPPDTTT